MTHRGDTDPEGGSSRGGGLFDSYCEDLFGFFVQCFIVYNFCVQQN